MDYKKVLLIVVGVVLTIQLCGSNGIKSETNYLNDAMDQSIKSADVDSDNVTAEDTMTTTPMTSTIKSDIRIVDQNYTQNARGEYKHEVLFSNQNWRAEHGEYEDRDGAVVFIIRGVFQYHSKEGTYKTTFYIVDEFGYHNVEPPPELSTQDGEGLVDYRPEFGSASGCGNNKETYCVDPKLLALLVG